MAMRVDKKNDYDKIIRSARKSASSDPMRYINFYWQNKLVQTDGEKISELVAAIENKNFTLDQLEEMRMHYGALIESTDFRISRRESSLSAFLSWCGVAIAAITVMLQPSNNWVLLLLLCITVICLLASKAVDILLMANEEAGRGKQELIIVQRAISMCIQRRIEKETAPGT